MPTGPENIQSPNPTELLRDTCEVPHGSHRTRIFDNIKSNIADAYTDTLCRFYF